MSVNALNTLECTPSPDHPRSYDLGAAREMLYMCFWKLRFVPIGVRAQLKAEGLWQDLRQELYLLALEAWSQEMTPMEVFRHAQRGIRAFLKSYGYRPYRYGYVKLEVPLPWEVASPIPSGPASYMSDDELGETILRILRKYPEGLPRYQLMARLRICAQELDYHSARLVEQGLVTVVPGKGGNGKRLVLPKEGLVANGPGLLNG